MINTKVFVCFHKHDIKIEGEGLYPIHVGKAISSFDLGITGDDKADNISNKNPWYCELTAHYWAWKNVKDAAYVGLYHYRRVLDFNPSIFNKYRSYYFCDEKYFLQHSKVDNELLTKFDIVLPRPSRRPLPLGEELRLQHIYKDIDTLGDIVKELFPDYYPTYIRVMIKGNKYTSCNVLVAKKDVFDSYSKWLFDILFELENRLSVPCNPYQPRLFGFISERLMQVYVEYHKEYKIGYMPLLILNERHNKPLLFLKLKEKLRTLCCWLYKLTKT